ncbi:MAG TPA: HEAT repeat domain-containing protein [Vicinamibacterales bacterium]|nr:HEAT repeat domain-containing protein [Vicinamibacterales bacterium]
MTSAEQEAAGLILQFADAERRMETLLRLNAIGDAALPAVRAGLTHPDWHIRHWCAIFLDRGGDAESLLALVPLLHDPEPHVRLWAIHSIACEHCRNGACPIDVIPLLIERAENDPVPQVRKMAITMLAECPRDARIPPVLERALGREKDRRLLLHAQRGLDKYSAA